MLAILNNLSALSVLLPIGAAGLRYRSHDGVLRLLAWFMFISGLFELILFITSVLSVQNNLPITHVFAAVNLLFLSTLYYRTLHGRLLRRFIGLTTGLNLVFILYNALLPGSIWRFPSRPFTVQSALFIGLALLYFYQLLRQPAATALAAQPLFWINAGVLLYFSGNLFVFMLRNWLLLATPSSAHGSYWLIHSAMNILANLLYAVGLLCKSPRLP